MSSITGGISTVKNDVTTLLGKGVVKSVQRGVVQWAQDDGSAKEATVNFASINPSKTIVLLQSSYGVSGIRASKVTQASVAVLGATSMKLNLSLYTTYITSNNDPIYASWQIIEFY